MKYLLPVVTFTLALIVGLLAGFFIVFNSVFSDVNNTGERLFSFLLIIVTYGLLSLLFGFFGNSWSNGLWLAAPAVLLVLWYSLREPGNLPLHMAYIVVTLAASCAGASIGSRLRLRSPRLHTPD